MSFFADNSWSKIVAGKIKVGFQLKYFSCIFYLCVSMYACVQVVKDYTIRFKVSARLECVSCDATTHRLNTYDDIKRQRGKVLDFVNLIL